LKYSENIQQPSVDILEGRHIFGFVFPKHLKRIFQNRGRTGIFLGFSLLFSNANFS
jgi:hypothetical protein